LAIGAIESKCGDSVATTIQRLVRNTRPVWDYLRMTDNRRYRVRPVQARPGGNGVVLGQRGLWFTPRGPQYRILAPPQPIPEPCATMPASPMPIESDDDHGSSAGSSDPAPKPVPTPGQALGVGSGATVGRDPAFSGSRRHRNGRRPEGGSSSHGRTKKIGQLRLMVALLVVLVMAAAMTALYYSVKADALEGEVLSLSTDLSHTREELDETRDLLFQRDSEIGVMLARRIPGLTELSFDTLFSLDNKYMRKLTFSQSGVGQDKAIEFHAVLENKGSDPLLPDVKIVLFDRMGVQVGMVKIAREQSASTAALAELSPEETRAYSGLVPAERDAEPAYFLTQVR
jgi:hypothetical protein